jgi:hypothetical protein
MEPIYWMMLKSIHKPDTSKSIITYPDLFVDKGVALCDAVFGFYCRCIFFI